MQFKYNNFPHPAGGIVTRPVIQIRMRNLRMRSSPMILFEALVDSGSDRCIFSSDIADLLGIDVRATDAVLYVGGVVAGRGRPIYIHPVEIEVAGNSCGVVEVGFMPEFSRSGYGLLGRSGFFDRFSFVKFRENENVLEIGRLRRV